VNANIFEKANQIIKTCNTAYFGVIDENSYPSISAVSVIKPENLFEVYFATYTGSNKEKRLLKNSRACICFRTEDSNITLVGDAVIVPDQETKSRYWLDMFKEHWPSATDPNYLIVKLKTLRVSLWIDNESASFTIDELMTIQFI